MSEVCKLLFEMAIVKGLIEHGEGSVYFGSVGGYRFYCQSAEDMGWLRILSDNNLEITEFGRIMYERERLAALPNKVGSRAYMWRWECR